MSSDLSREFSRLDRPRSLIRAVIRFALFLCGGAMLYFIFPNSWDEWKAGIAVGLTAGMLWAVSWFFNGVENRLVVWLLICLGVMIFWGIRYHDFPSIGTMASMYAGFEFILLMLHNRLQRISSAHGTGKEETEQDRAPNP